MKDFVCGVFSNPKYRISGPSTLKPKTRPDPHKKDPPRNLQQEPEPELLRLAQAAAQEALVEPPWLQYLIIARVDRSPVKQRSLQAPSPEPSRPFANRPKQSRTGSLEQGVSDQCCNSRLGRAP